VAVNLFAYGSLLDKRVMFKVIGRSLPMPVPATLPGYRKFETTLGYPVVLPEAGSTCNGSVFFSLTPADWKRLDEYENAAGNPPAYVRRLVTLQGAYGSISAYVYIGNLNFFRTRLKL
jgi:gamma-glutamylcyclotransferase (GGCT)/AIG2-like uncharacterized protein YtfP